MSIHRSGRVLRAPAPGKQSRSDPKGAVTGTPGKRTLVESGGAPLPPATRMKFERAFGESFVDVRVHESGEPGALGAGAFARGNQIHVAPGRYAPGTVAGDRLLGHELAHVVQQRGGRVAGEGGALNADASLEGEADALGARAAAGEMVRVGGGAGSVPASPSVQAAPIQCIDQRDQAKLPTSAQQDTLRGHLDPNTRQQPQQPQQTQGAPVPWDGETDQPNYEDSQRAMRKEMFVALQDFRDRNDPAVQKGKSARRVPMTQDGGQRGDTGVLGIAQRAQAAIAARFGQWIANGVRGETGKQAMTSIDLHAGQEIVDGNDRAQHRQALGVSAKVYANDTGWWAARNHLACRDVLANHHWTPEGNGRGFLQWVVGLWLDQGDNRDWMADYHTFCISEHARNSIILDTTIDPHGHQDANAAERAKRWSLFGTSVHELMHGCAHPAFVAATRGRPVMHEGFTEHLAAEVATPLVADAAAGSNEALRLVVEGNVATLIPQHIAPYHTPSAYAGHVAEVVGMKDLVGEQALLAAYFQGHVEFLGLGPDGKQGTDVRPDRGEPPLRVPPGMDTLSNLAWRTNVNTDLLKYANKSKDLQEDISMHDKLVLPDCREHLVVEAEGAPETLELIARQHGTSKLSIMDANPDRPVKAKQQPGEEDTWYPLQAGDRILIPKRW